MARILISDIQKRVCKRFGVHRRELKGRYGEWRIVRPRQVGMYLSRHLTEQSFNAIGRRFARDHSTVMYACRQVEKLRAADPEIDAAVRELAEQLSPPQRDAAHNQGA